MRPLPGCMCMLHPHLAEIRVHAPARYGAELHARPRLLRANCEYLLVLAEAGKARGTTSL
eukprot:347842-Chlamydomonas_euryale.AAC.4